MTFISKVLSFFKRGKDFDSVFPGVLLDTRTPPFVAREDVFLGEIIANPEKAETWREVPMMTQHRMYGVQDQAGQSSCVANAGRKALRVMFEKNYGYAPDLSSLHIYRRRANFSEPGMHGHDLWNVLKTGATLNDIVPSDGKSEAEANALKIDAMIRTTGEAYSISEGIILPAGDIDAVAATIYKTGKAVVLFYYFSSREWSREVPTTLAPGVDLYSPTTLRHAVAAVDAIKYNGEKYLVIEDSAHFGGIHTRYITEKFHNARNYYAAYPMSFKFEETLKPRFAFNRDLKLGEQSDEVSKLQDCLKHAGFMPTNVASTGFYGALTAKAVLGFQKKHAVASLAALDRLAGESVGPATRQALNAIYGTL